MNRFSKKRHLTKFSNPALAQRMATKYLGKTAKLYPSTKKEKKYMIQDPKTGGWVHFGQMGYQDYTRHRDKTRRKNYLTRSTHIKGQWATNKYSPNNLAIHVLW
jgi:Family of unknown function (DUF5754)